MTPIFGLSRGGVFFVILVGLFAASQVGCSDDNPPVEAGDMGVM